MKKTIAILMILSPLTAFAVDFSSGFTATTTSSGGGVFPTKINGSFPYVQAPWFYGTSTATSTFNGGIQAVGLQSSNGLTITGGTFLIPSNASVDITGTDTDFFKIHSVGTAHALHIGRHEIGGVHTSFNNNTTGHLTSDGSIVGIESDGDLTLRNLESGNIVFETNNTEQAVLNNVGNFGLGTTTPGTLLSLGNTGSDTINILPTATSTFGRGISTGGLSTSNGLNITGGNLDYRGSGEVRITDLTDNGDAIFGIYGDNGAYKVLEVYNAQASSILLNAHLNDTDSATSTFTGGIEAGGLTTSEGLTITGGSIKQASLTDTRLLYSDNGVIKVINPAVYTLSTGAFDWRCPGDGGGVNCSKITADGGGIPVLSVYDAGPFLINESGQQSAAVGHGTTTPSSWFSIKGPSGGIYSTRLFNIADNSNVDQFVVTSGGLVGIGLSNPTVALDVSGTETKVANFLNTSATGGGLSISITESDANTAAFEVYDTGGTRNLFNVGPTIDIDFAEINVGANMHWPTDGIYNIGSATERPANLYLSTVADRGVLFGGASGILSEDVTGFSYDVNTDSLFIQNLFASSSNFGNGSFTYADATGTTTIANLETGFMSFQPNAGVVTWLDLPVSTAGNNLTQSYTAQLDGIDMFTIYGVSNGAGGIRNTGTGIGSTSPLALLSIQQNHRAASSTNSLQISSSTSSGATMEHFKIDNKGHVVTKGPTPSVTSCGTSPAVVGSDINGRVTIGTAIGVDNTCTVTFANTWSTAPSCFVNNETQVLLARAVAGTASFTFDVAATFTDSDVYNYHCEGY